MSDIHLAIVDSENKEIYIEYPEGVVRYDLHMYEAALNNSKYWEEAELEWLCDKTIPELILELDPIN